MNSGIFNTSSSSLRLFKENRILNLTLSGKSSLNFFRLLLVTFASALTSTGKISFSLWIRKSTSYEYLFSIPSFHHSLKMFHANKDCAEVREKVYKMLKTQDVKFFCIVARKDENLFRNKFNFNQKRLYKYLVSKLLENRLHLYKHIDLYFSAMGSTVHQSAMKEAVNYAIHSFSEKWNTENTNDIRVFIQQNSEIPLLQASDYMLWSIQRAYERGDFRYYNFIKDKICLIHDVFDFGKYPHNYYTLKNPLTKEKIDPV